jgi:hypothetical protein
MQESESVRAVLGELWQIHRQIHWKRRKLDGELHRGHADVGNLHLRR